MRSIFFVIFLILSSAYYCLADSAPCWCNFEIKSRNGAFVAHVYKDSTKTEAATPIFNDWVLSVYDTKSNTLLWRTDYEYSGYPDGFLSDNGKHFVYVEYWYYEDVPLLKIYSKGKRIATDKLTGASFNIDREKITETVSHSLWLSHNGAFATFKQDDLELTTIDERKHRINLSSGKKK